MKLKDTIKKNIKQKKSDPQTLELITKKKSQAVKNNLFDLYNHLSKIEHSLYRYNTLLNSKLFDEAENESQNLMNLVENFDSGNITLKGGISNTRYIWHTEPNACKDCQALDGKVYYLLDDVPEKLHPNCKCTVEEVTDDEMCDCYIYFQQLDDVANEVETALPEVYNAEAFISEALGIFSTNTLSSLGFTILGEIETAKAAYHDFQKNKAEMISTGGYDKYYHARANCEATKRGITGEAIAYVASYGKEVHDIFKKVLFEKMTFEKAWNDSLNDLKADKYGMEQGHLNGSCSVDVLNVGDIINKKR